MVLQVMSPAIRELAPEPKRDDTWFWPTTDGSTRRTASRLPPVSVSGLRQRKELDRIGDVGITERHRSGKIRSVLLNTIVQVDGSVVA
jgi:hypothetical protein